MDVLIRYGFSIEEIKNMMDSNPDICNVDDSVIYKLIDLLGYVGCLSNHIKNIFICNPFYLSRNVNDVEDLIDKFKSLGFVNLNILFDSNPYILSLDSNNLENMYDKLLNDGMSDTDIINKFKYDSFDII